VLHVYNERAFSVVNSSSNLPNFITFPGEVFRFRGSQLLIYNERTFSMVGFPSNLPNFQKFSWKVFVCGTPCYWYITRGLFQTTPPPQGTLHDGFLVRANSAVHRHKEPYIRNPGIPPHPKQGILDRRPAISQKGGVPPLPAGVRCPLIRPGAHFAPRKSLRAGDR